MAGKASVHATARAASRATRMEPPLGRLRGIGSPTEYDPAAPQVSRRSVSIARGRASIPIEVLFLICRALEVCPPFPFGVGWSARTAPVREHHGRAEFSYK